MKNKFRGTIGKWKCSNVMNFSGTLVSFIESDEKGIAQLRGCVNGDEIEAEANAKLIANAPELLFALQEMIAFAEFHGYKSSTEINNARKVLEETLT